jgi:hypothetical protein
MAIKKYLHRIKAYLYPNALTQENANDYVARVTSEPSLDVKQIAESAAERGGADISAAAMEHAANLWFREMAYRLCDGFSINTGWFTASVHIKGVFESPQEHFDPAKHSILFEFHQGAELRKELDSVTVDIMGVAGSGASIAQVTDTKTGSVNEFLTPGGNMKIAGHKIKIAGDRTPDTTGVYFRAQETPDVTFKVAANDIVVNNPRELIIVIPVELSPDYTYKLEVSTQYAGSNKLLNEPRIAVFDIPLKVSP